MQEEGGGGGKPVPLGKGGRLVGAVSTTSRLVAKKPKES
jgi:hypothetical protein